MNKVVLLLTSIVFTFSACHSQDPRTPDAQHSAAAIEVGGPFENSELMYDGLPEHINSIDTTPGWHQKGQKLNITGTVYQLDGKTPAPNVLLYFYHTDIEGLYSAPKGTSSKGHKHGYIRSWVETDQEGKYSLYTVRPAPYPNHKEAAHIHLSVKEPNNLKEYYVDALVFDDDIILTSKVRRDMDNRGGSGVLRLLKDGDLHVGEHNIILGLNIPDYP